MTLTSKPRRRAIPVKGVDGGKGVCRHGDTIGDQFLAHFERQLPRRLMRDRSPT